MQVPQDTYIVQEAMVEARTPLTPLNKTREPASAGSSSAGHFPTAPQRPLPQDTFKSGAQASSALSTDSPAQQVPRVNPLSRHHRPMFTDHIMAADSVTKPSQEQAIAKLLSCGTPAASAHDLLHRLQTGSTGGSTRHDDTSIAKHTAQTDSSGSCQADGPRHADCHQCLGSSRSVNPWEMAQSQSWGSTIPTRNASWGLVTSQQAFCDQSWGQMDLGIAAWDWSQALAHPNCARSKDQLWDQSKTAGIVLDSAVGLTDPHETSGDQPSCSSGTVGNSPEHSHDDSLRTSCSKACRRAECCKGPYR